MPVEIDLGMPPGGYAVSSARAGETVRVQVLEFTSTEDGSHFIQRLEGLPSDIIGKPPSPVLPSRVDHMLAICRRDGKATVWVNELMVKASTRVSRAIEAGEEVTKDDIVDLESVELGVHIPADAGVLFVFSVGWRKGLFYDFSPVSGPDPHSREYDIASLLGRLYCHLTFQERFAISDEEWRALFAAMWFPFAGLSNDAVAGLMSHVRAGWQPDENLGDIVAEVKKKAEKMLQSWRGHSSFAHHVGLLERAIERFVHGDPVSCTALLFPRIEGILRTHRVLSGAQTGFRQENLVQTAVASKIDNMQSALLPHRFAEYLREVYFRNFSPTEHNPDVSRHTIGHGIADAAKFDEKSAVIGLLILHQLFYCLENKKGDTR